MGSYPKQTVISLFGPENEMDKIISSNDPLKVDKAIGFLMRESDTFLDLKHMITEYKSNKDFNSHLSDMVLKASRLRKKVLKSLPKQFKFWEISKKYKAIKLIKTVNRKT